MTDPQRDTRRKLHVLQHGRETGNAAKTARHFGISRQTYYVWKRAYEVRGEAGLVNGKPCPQNLGARVPAEVEEKILYLRRSYHFGPMQLACYLKCHHNIAVSNSGVYSVLCRSGLNRLASNYRKRSIVSTRYEKQVPGHHVQADVKFLHFTDSGHEFPQGFHWRVEDLGMRHVYIKPASPNLNGKVERSHLTDQLEFYQLLDADDVDLNRKLAAWEESYNVRRPHSALKGKTSYEVLKEKLVL